VFNTGGVSKLDFWIVWTIDRESGVCGWRSNLSKIGLNDLIDQKGLSDESVDNYNNTRDRSRERERKERD
jgi:hypothetical protein